MSTEDKENKMNVPKQRSYTKEFRADAVKLSEKIGTNAAAQELNIPQNTLSHWISKSRSGHLPQAGQPLKPTAANSLADENARLRMELRECQRKLAEEREVNAILDKAARFFAVSRKS